MRYSDGRFDSGDRFWSARLSTLREKVLGGLYGQALGDAWAMPAYFAPERTRQVFGTITEFLPAKDDHDVHAGLPAGRITDDSEQAFSLAREYIKAGAVTLEATVTAIVDWYDRTGGDESRYVGPSTRRGVQALKRGENPHETGRMGDTNGGSMRVSVVGLLHPGDPMGAIRDAMISCLPTHGTNVAISGACAVAAGTAVAMHAHATLDAVIAAGMLGAEIGRQQGSSWIGASVTRKIEQAVRIVRGAGTTDDKLRAIYDEVGTSLATPETVGASFGVFLLAAGDPKTAAIHAAALSGDADTVGAIACALCGAFRGIGAFEQDIIDTLDNDPVFADYHVRDIADGLIGLIEARR
jgi:ADP-ribosylglycohydrolase